MILWFSAITLFAQEGHKQSLRSIIADLEDQYAVSFAFFDEDIENVFLPPPSDDYNLDEVIEYLENQTKLVFQVLNDRFITISKKKADPIDICGVLIDDETVDLINGATIQMGRKFTVSNEYGYFQKKGLSEKDTLLIRFVGYEYLRVPVKSFSGKSCDTLRLKQQIKRLKELTIMNFITQGIDKNAEGEYMINSQELGILPGLTEPDVLQTIQALPGILSIHETVSDINARGGTNDQNLILWNGIRMYQSGHFFGLISAFNPFISKEVGLIKNGSSAYYGDAVSSTVNIQTDNQVRQKFSGSAGVNMINADLNVVIPLFKKSSLQISSRRSIADIIQTPTYKSYYDRVFRNTEVNNPLDSPDSLINTDEKI